MSLPKVKAIILNFNGGQWIIECLKSLMRVEYPQFYILVVDNGSTDNSLAEMKAGFPSVEFYATGKNLGYTGGINAGFEKVLHDSPDYVLVLNPDTEVDASFLTRLVEAMEKNTRAVAAGGTIYAQHDKKRIWYAGGRMVAWRGLALHDHAGQLLEPSLLGKPRQVTFITGCLVLFRTSLLKDIGFEDERFFMYLDDMEFSARMINKGYELLYVPQAIVYHKVFGEKDSQFKLYYSVRNRLLLINTGFSGYSKFVARLYFLVVISAKILVWCITRPLFARTAAIGIVDYFKGNFGEGRGVKEFSARQAS